MRPNGCRHGRPAAACTTNVSGIRPGFRFSRVGRWTNLCGEDPEFSRPGKPTGNAFAESFNGRFRAECLDCHWFASLEEARQTIEACRIECNTEHPHQALGQETPMARVSAREHLAEAPG